MTGLFHLKSKQDELILEKRMKGLQKKLKLKCKVLQSKRQSLY
jgi:hypothetical protein